MIQIKNVSVKYLMTYDRVKSIKEYLVQITGEDNAYWGKLPVYERPDDDANCREWNFATLTGRGIYKGDVLTLYNPVSYTHLKKLTELYEEGYRCAEHFAFRF